MPDHSALGRAWLALAALVAAVVLVVLLGARERPDRPETSAEVGRGPPRPTPERPIHPDLAPPASSPSSERAMVSDGAGATEPASEEAAVEVRVHVVDDVGRPVAGTDVKMGILDSRDRRDVAFLFDVGETDADGRATLRVLPGTYFVGANVERGDSPDALPGRRKDVGSAFAEPLEVRPPGAEIELVVKRRDAVVHVAVRDDRGRPVEGIEVDVHTAGPSRATGADGRATFPGVVWGAVGARLVSDRVGPGGEFSCERTRARSEVAPGGTASIELVLVRNGALEVRMAEAECDGGRATVWIDRVEGVGERGRFSSEPLGPGEAWFVAGVPPGTYRVRCRFDDPLCPCIARGVESVVVAPGRTVEVLVPVTRHPGVVSGRVVDHAGVGRRGVRVSVGPRWVPGAPARWIGKGAVTDAAGRFRLAGVPSEPIVLGVDPTGAEGDALAFHGTFEEGSLIELPGPREELIVPLARGYRVEGRVVPASRDVAVPDGARVVIDRRRFQGVADRESLSADDGHRFAFTNLRAGVYRLTLVDGDGRTLDAATVEVGGGPATPRVVEVRLVVDPEAEAEGGGGGG